MIYARPGDTFTASALDAPSGETMQVGIRDSADNLVSAYTSTGVSESTIEGVTVYTASLVAPSDLGTYFVFFRYDPGTGYVYSDPDELRVTTTLPADPTTGPLYTNISDLRAKLKVDSSQLPDDEATDLIVAAEDLIDDRLGVWPVDPDTGRKIIAADFADETWRLDKLAGATLEVAANLFADPGVEARQRARSVSGDVTTTGVWGPAYGERCQALLTASGLVRNTTRMRPPRIFPALGHFS